MKYVTLQLRNRRANPFTKLYVFKEDDEATRDFVMKGLPCALLLTQEACDLQAWLEIIDKELTDCIATYGMSRRETTEKSAPSVRLKVTSDLKRIFDVDSCLSLAFVVPIFQRYMNWKPGEALASIQPPANGEKQQQPGFVIDKFCYYSADVLPKTAGPPMKLPNGEILPSCCEGCNFNTSNIMGLCSFGSPECFEQIEFPGKTNLLKNLRKFVEEFEGLEEV